MSGSLPSSWTSDYPVHYGWSDRSRNLQSPFTSDLSLWSTREIEHAWSSSMSNPSTWRSNRLARDRRPSSCTLNSTIPSLPFDTPEDSQVSLVFIRSSDHMEMTLKTRVFPKISPAPGVSNSIPKRPEVPHVSTASPIISHLPRRTKDSPKRPEVTQKSNVLPKRLEDTWTLNALPKRLRVPWESKDCPKRSEEPQESSVSPKRCDVPKESNISDVSRVFGARKKVFEVPRATKVSRANKAPRATKVPRENKEHLNFKVVPSFTKIPQKPNVNMSERFFLRFQMGSVIKYLEVPSEERGQEVLELLPEHLALQKRQSPNEKKYKFVDLVQISLRDMYSVSSATIAEVEMDAISASSSSHFGRTWSSSTPAEEKWNHSRSQFHGLWSSSTRGKIKVNGKSVSSTSQTNATAKEL